MSGKVIQINLKANVDEALSKISGASSQIASSLKVSRPLKMDYLNQ